MLEYILPPHSRRGNHQLLFSIWELLLVIPKPTIQSHIYMSVRHSYLSMKYKEEGIEETERERGVGPWSPQDWFTLIAMYGRLGIRASLPLSTQSPSLGAGRTASLVPRWMLARRSGLASTCRCRAAGFNWQQERRRRRAVHEMTRLPSLSLSDLP